MEDLILNNVSIVNNSADKGGGLCAWDANLSLSNVTVSNNIANDKGGGILTTDSSTIVVNSILWNNSPDQISGPSPNIFYSDVMNDWMAAIGTINRDPLFVDTANGDYRLQMGSPCIDVGTAFFIYQGDTLINLQPGQYNGTAPDMGAFEFGPILDITNDQKIARFFTLYQNYPNPFNPITTFSWQLAVSSTVKLTVYNTIGEEVATLLSASLLSGSYEVEWDASRFASGVYLYRLQAGDYVETRKMVLMK